tara:strand:- start:3598 stop:4542 length:945 start_codon:yes stop_codon:yes gene_type:complete
MAFLSIRKIYLYNIFKALLAFFYGYFILLNINLDLVNDSGDISSLLKQVENKINDPDLTFEYLFYFLINKVNDLFNVDYFTIFKSIAFFSSIFIFYIFSINSNFKSNSIYLIILFFLIFITPRTYDLFASGIRSGFAFSIFFLALIYKNQLLKYSLYILSCYIHFSMIPFIGLLVSFNLIKILKLNISKFLIFNFLIFFAILMNYLTNVYLDVTFVSQSFRYKILILFIFIIFLTLDQKVYRNRYGFISIGILSIVIIGFIFDTSYVRYIGNSLLFYLYFLIEHNNRNSIKIFLICYAPIFFLMSFYSIRNIYG